MLTDMVNTFLPYASFKRSARVLDRQRLGRQRTEVVMILRALHGETEGYAHHPATIMWRGREAALTCYGFAICDEWTSRGYTDNQRAIMKSYFPFARYTSPLDLRTAGLLPWWFGWREFHESHRSNLMRKNAEWYNERLGDDEFFQMRPDLPYIWPSDQPRVWKAQHAKGSPYT